MWQREIIFKMRMQKQRFEIALIVIIAVVIQIGIVSAVFYACFDQGEIIDYCNPSTPDRTCGSSSGCAYCMTSYNDSRQCYNQGNINACNSIPYECGNDENNHTIDLEAPILTIDSPINGEIYQDRTIYIILESNEKVDVYYTDYINNNGKWTNVCRGCMSYDRKRSFKEGLNNLTFRAIDTMDNIAYENISFFVDSKYPSVSTMEPRNNDFASGQFLVTFRENNPVSVVLYYGNDETGWRDENLDVDDCTLNRGKHSCETLVDLEDYDGEELFYWFNVTDIAGSSDSKKAVKVKVDTTSPVINYINYTIKSNRVTFNMNISEINFDEAEYIDNSASRPRWSTFCGSLKSDGTCIKTLSLTAGTHSIDIQVSDDAGNSVGQHLDVVV